MPTVEEALRARGDDARGYLTLIAEARAVVAAAEAECTPEAGERFALATVPLFGAAVAAIMSRLGGRLSEHGLFTRVTRILDGLMRAD
jgi:hypothetical protein